MDSIPFGSFTNNFDNGKIFRNLLDTIYSVGVPMGGILYGFNFHVIDSASQGKSVSLISL